MHIEIGGSYGEPKQKLDTDTVRFVAPDGRDMFEITIQKDGKSIEIRGVTTTRVNGVLYSETLSIQPQSRNGVIISVTPYN